MLFELFSSITSYLGKFISWTATNINTDFMRYDALLDNSFHYITCSNVGIVPCNYGCMYNFRGLSDCLCQSSVIIPELLSN